MFKFSKKNRNNSKPQEEKKKKIRRKEGWYEMDKKETYVKRLWKNNIDL